MKSLVRAKLLRVYMNENDRFANRTLYVTLTNFLKENNMLLVTVLRGTMGMGRSNQLRKPRLLPIPNYLPIILECLDEAEKMDSVLIKLGPILEGYLYTIEEGELWK